MSKTSFPITIYHNPACGTSRNTLALIRAAGYEPEVVEYVKTGWTRPLLARLITDSGLTARALLREKNSPAEELGLLGSSYYVNQAMMPLGKASAMINMDMIGRMVAVADKDDETKKLDRLVVYGTGTEAALDALVEKTNKDFRFKMMKVPGGRGPSDHTSFYNK